MTPDDRMYVKTHEWIRVEDDIAMVGITDHAQEALGDITFVELPTVGEFVQQGGECGVIESVKAASDIYAPVSGVVAEVNSELEERPETINSDPYEDGWILKLKRFEEEDIEALLSAAEYLGTLGPDE